MRNLLKTVGVIFGFGGFIFLMGTVGADDVATMSGQVVFTFGELFARCLLGIGLICAGIFTFKIGDFLYA